MKTRGAGARVLLAYMCYRRRPAALGGHILCLSAAEAELLCGCSLARLRCTRQRQSTQRQRGACSGSDDVAAFAAEGGGGGRGHSSISSPRRGSSRCC